MSKAKAAPKTVEELIAHALKLAATNPKAKWTGASAAALFSTKEANTEAAIAECTKADAPLLKQAGAVGVLTAAGFERVAAELSGEDARAVYERLGASVAEEEIGTLAKVATARMALAERVEFIQGVIGRTPLAVAELTPLLEEAVAAEKADHAARVAATAKRRAAEEASLRALERAKQLFAERRQNRLDALRREWEAEGESADTLPAHKPALEPEPKAERKPAAGHSPEPRTAEEKDFRRSECDRLAAAWRDAWDAGKFEGRDYLETAMWNIRGLRMIGETDATVRFDGRVHESDGPAFTDDAVKVGRPGWLLKTEDEEYVALKARVTPV